MTEQSRREFIRRCLRTGAAACPALSLCVGCGPRGASTSRSDASERREQATGTASADPAFEPAYLKLHRSGELKKRGDYLWERMKPCKLCPRNCEVDRLAGQKGFCQSGSDLVVASYQAHFGEERPLVGRGGSGTIFFSHCGLRCVFCINYEISLLGEGTHRRIEDVANMMLSLQRRGCHNINVVTPSHYSAHIVRAWRV